MDTPTAGVVFLVTFYSSQCHKHTILNQFYPLALQGAYISSQNFEFRGFQVVKMACKTTI